MQVRVRYGVKNQRVVLIMPESLKNRKRLRNRIQCAFPVQGRLTGNRRWRDRVNRNNLEKIGPRWCREYDVSPPR